MSFRFQEKDKFWFNHQLLFYRDEKYNTTNSISVTVSTNTINFKDFSSPSLNILIQGEIKTHSLKLSFQDVFDLSLSCKEIFLNVDQIYEESRKKTFEIFRNYNFNRSLKIGFRYSSNTGERCVIIQIIYSNSDHNFIIIPFPVFISVFKIIENFSEKYIDLNFNFVNRILNTCILEEIKTLNTSIRSLPSFITDLKTNSNTPINIGNLDDNFYGLNFNEFIGREPPADAPSTKPAPVANLESFNTEDASVVMKDFNMFIDNEIENIEIPELKQIEESNFNIIKKEPIKTEIKSKLFDDFFHGDFSFVDTFFGNLMISSSPISHILNSLDSVINFDKNENLSLREKFLVGMDEDTFKTYIYVSTTNFQSILRSYLKSKKEIPENFELMTYKIPNKNEISTVNLELAYDFCVLMIVVKLANSAFRHRENHPEKNKSILYMALRLFFDPFIFPYFHEKNLDSVINVIFERFNYFHENGFFKSLYRELEWYNISEVSIFSEFKNMLKKLFSFIYSDDSFEKNNIEIIHNSLFENQNFKLPIKNTFSAEQIEKEIIPLEIHRILGFDLKDESVIKTIFNMDQNSNLEISKEVLKLYQKNLKRKTAVDENESYIIKFSKKFIHEIPKNKQIEYIEYLNETENDPIEFKTFPIKLEEIGDNILKGIYVWNFMRNEEIFKSYKDFYSEIDSIPFDRTMIISKIKYSEKENISVDDDEETSWFESV